MTGVLSFEAESIDKFDRELIVVAWSEYAVNVAAS
jgi:hypothetical protein